MERREIPGGVLIARQSRAVPLTSDLLALMALMAQRPALALTLRRASTLGLRPSKH
ncbi:MAG: hypothetical protein NVS3B5_09190 [Sphingomicrobium sp.]